MTQDELQCLILGMMTELDTISKGQHYLQIAIEQLENSDTKTNERVELLVSTYLSLSDCVLDNLKSDFRKLRRQVNKDFDLFNK